MLQLKAITKIVAGVALMILAITALIAWVSACFGTVIIGVVMKIHVNKYVSGTILLGTKSLLKSTLILAPIEALFKGANISKKLINVLDHK